MDSYIKMSEEAEEIQKLWRPHSCDYYYDKFSGTKKFVTNYDLSNPKMYDCLIKNKNYIWLPIQKQLQEMSDLSWWEFDKRCNDIRQILLEDPLSGIEVETKEQVGICVLMEKYNKIWNGKDWKTIK